MAHRESEPLERPTAGDLLRLLEGEEGLRVSLYVPALVGEASRQNAIRRKNLLREAERQLVARGANGREFAPRLDAELAPRLEEALERSAEGAVAAFFEPGTLRCFRLPRCCPELVVVGRRYHVTPLLPTLADRDRFYVLALSQNETRLLCCAEDAAHELPLAGAPLRFDETAGFSEPAAKLQLHTGASGGRGERPAVYHGHRKDLEQANERLLRFFRKVDRSVVDALADDDAPLLVAAVEYLHPIYRDANRYPGLVEQRLDGNPEGLSAEELRQRAWELVRPHLTRDRDRALLRYRALAGTPRSACELTTIVTAAHDGRVESLFVAPEVHRWGAFDRRTRELQLYDSAHEEAEDVLDLATARTLLTGGAVYAVRPEQLPGNAAAAAVLRY